MRKIHGIIILSLLLLCSHNAFAVGAPDYLPDGAHPRITTAAMIARYQALHDAHNNDQWLQLEADLADDPIYASDWASEYNEHLPYTMAILWKVTNDNNMKTGAITNLLAGVDYYDPLFKNSGPVNDNWRWNTYTLFAAYDLLYSELTPTQRKDIANKFAVWAKHFHDIGYKRDDPGNNYFGAHYRGAALVGIITYGEIIDDANAAQPLIILNWTKPGGDLFETMKSAYQPGGMYDHGLLTEGPEYTPQTVSYILEGMGGIKIATGLDLFADPALHFWFIDHAKYLLYDMTYPGTSFPRGDWLNGYTEMDPTVITRANVQEAALLSDYVDIPYANYLRRYLENFMPTDGAWWRPEDKGTIYFGTGAKTGIKSSYTELPLKWFSGNNLGIVYGLSSWSNQNTTWQFQAGWRGTDHMHAETGHFVIKRKGEWLINHESSYGYLYHDPGPHNVFMIQGSQPINRWTLDVLTPLKWNKYHQYGLPNNDFSYPPNMKDLPDLDYKNGAWFQVARGNLTNHYWHPEYNFHVPRPLNNYWRTFVEIDDGIFVIEDRYDLVHCLDKEEYDTDPNQQKDCYVGFQLHTLRDYPAVVSGNVITQSTGTSDMTITSVTSPSSTTWTLEHESTEKGGDYTAFPHYDIAKMAGPTETKKGTSLVIIDMRDSGIPARSVSQLVADTMSGAQVGNNIILFANNFYDIDVTTVNYIINTMSTTRHLLSGMKKNTTYNVAINGGMATQYVVDDGGVLAFNTLETGNIQISITENGATCPGTPSICTQQECSINGFNWCNNYCQTEVCSLIIRADVDQNGTVNSTDAMLTLRNSLGLDMSGTNWQASATTGDVNCDDITNSTDAMLILRQSLGLDMAGTGWCGN